MVNVIVSVILILMVSCAIAYIVREKKRGVKCVGCPMAGTCAQHHGRESCSGSCSASTGIF